MNTAIQLAGTATDHGRDQTTSITAGNDRIGEKSSGTDPDTDDDQRPRMLNSPTNLRRTTCATAITHVH